jgi:hypothetical protein
MAMLNNQMVSNYIRIMDIHRMFWRKAFSQSNMLSKSVENWGYTGNVNMTNKTIQGQLT